MKRLVAVLLTIAVTASSSWAQVAYWNGRAYTARVCSNPRCGMCASIQSQLNQYRAATLVARKPVEVTPSSITLEWVPMPMPVVHAMLGVIDPQPHETLYDVGCGDGRILSEANSMFRCSVLGIELNPDTWAAATARMKADNCHGWRIVRGDATEFSLANADIVTLYLYPHVMERLQWDTLKPGARVISYSHDIPGLATEVYRCSIDGHEHEFYIHYHPN